MLLSTLSNLWCAWRSSSSALLRSVMSMNDSTAPGRFPDSSNSAQHRRRRHVRSMVKHIRECKVAYFAFAQFSLRGPALAIDSERSIACPIAPGGGSWALNNFRPCTPACTRSILHKRVVTDGRPPPGRHHSACARSLTLFGTGLVKVSLQPLDS
jgi:hypothetical protein